ncbi:MAG: NADPH:quinone reductase [Magnetovibrio sp.]|nr:NADPH:quinone reductase [Magnetovibrio sp.]
MKAYWYENAGAAADVLVAGEMNAGEPGPGEVRVRIAVSGVNPTDAKRRERGRELGRFPRIVPNNDGAGVIDAVGAGVDAGRVGERVWIFGAQAGRPMGTAAEYCVLPSRQARPLPDDAGFEDGACLGVPAVTAHRGLFADGPIDGKTVLITGGGGRVGRYAVQMAKHAGATVIATAGSEEKVAHVAELGADHALDYKSDDVAGAVAEVTGGRGVDRMLDVAFGANVAGAAGMIRENGVLASYGSDAVPAPSVPFYEFMYKNVLIRPFAIFGMPDAAKDAAFAHVDALLAAGALAHRVGARFAFEEMVQAHEAIEADTLFGACLVEVSKMP